MIALHPDYSFSYAPGLITAVNDSDLEILFYDGRSALLPLGEVYHYHPVKTSKKEKANVSIPQMNDVTLEEQKKSGGGSAKYKQDVAYIRAREEKLLGAAVVAREDMTGSYYPGKWVMGYLFFKSILPFLMNFDNFSWSIIQLINYLFLTACKIHQKVKYIYICRGKVGFFFCI